MLAILQNMTASRPVDLEALARDHYPAIFRFCAGQVGADLAADAAQETFLTAQRTAARFRGESSARTWLFGIAVNECRRLRRKTRRDLPLLELEGSPAPSPAQAWIDREVLTRALNALSVDHREAVLLHEVEGLTYDECAAALGVPAGTVKSRLHHAFAALRRALEQGEIQ